MTYVYFFLGAVIAFVVAAIVFIVSQAVIAAMAGLSGDEWEE